MKSFFRFTAGEWAASALIGLLLLAGILFYFLYENNAVAHAGSAEYQELSYKFELEQQRLKDSMKAAHTKDYRITGLRNEKGTGLHVIHLGQEKIPPIVMIRAKHFRETV